MIPDLNEEKIRDYIRIRIDEQAGGRTINMEVGELSRAVARPCRFCGGRCGSRKSARISARRSQPKRKRG